MSNLPPTHAKEIIDSIAMNYKMNLLHPAYRNLFAALSLQRRP